MANASKVLNGYVCSKYLLMCINENIHYLMYEGMTLGEKYLSTVVRNRHSSTN